MSFVLKREGSFNEDDHPSKFKKVTDSFLGFLKKKIGNRSQDEYVEDSFQQDSLLEQQTDILHPDTTSLQDVDSMADQTTRPSNTFSSYYDLLKRQKEQSEQTGLHKSLATAQPKRVHPRPSSQPDEEDVSLLSKRQRDTSSLNLVPPSKKLKSVDSVRTSLVDINPMERALLINLKERMEMDKYFKSRVKYMGFHNRHVRNNAGKNSFQNTRTQSPLFLRSVSTKQNPKTAISQERKKHGGYFSGDFEYDLDDSANNYPENQNLLQYKPAVSSLKFTDKPQEKYHPKPVNEADVERIANGKVTGSASKNVQRNVPETKNDSIGPSIGFSFGDNPSTYETGSISAAVKPTSQSLVVNNKLEEDKTQFAFGKAQEKKDSESSQKIASKIDFPPSTKKEAPKPAFSFTIPSVEGTNGQTKDSNKPSLSFAPKSTPVTESKPVFSFGAPKNNDNKQEDTSNQVSFAAGNPTKPTTAVPKFSFGESGDKKELPKPGAITFGTGSKPSTDEKLKEQSSSSKVVDTGSSENAAPKPAFSFGLPATTSQKDDSTKPKFSFGSASAASSEKTADTQPNFSFGAVTTTKEKNDNATPIFSFGSANGSSSTEKKEDGKPSFSFASTEQAAEPQSKPAFSINVPNDQKTESKPTFSFTAPSEGKTTETNSAGSKPAINFNAPASKETSKPAFSFNVSSEKKDQPSTIKLTNQDNEPSSTPKTAFSFGNTNVQSESNNNTQQTFSFGKESANNSNKRTFGFEETNTASKSSAPAFGFNVPGNTSKPSFGLGNEKRETLPTQGLSFNNNSNANSFGFGSVNSNVASAGSSKEPTPSVANFSSSKGTFGTNTQPSVNNNTFQFGAATGTNPSVNGSDHNTFTQPQVGFNPSRSATPNFHFTGTNQLDPAAIFGGPAPGTTSSIQFGQSSVQLNQPQPQAQPNAGFSFGFGNQQQQPSGTPTPSTTPGVKGRVLARMRQRRRN